MNITTENDSQEFNLDAKTGHYTLSTSEWFGTKNPRYFLIRSELQGNDSTTLFLLGVDGLMISTKYSSVAREDVTKMLYTAATDAITDYIDQNGLIKGQTYYGEFLQDGTFEISVKKPEWEDGNWGQKVNF
jgi:hypothetical protein